MHVYDLVRELPIDSVDLGFRFELEKAEIKCLLRFFFDLLNVVQTLETIATLQTLFHIENFSDQFVIFFAGFHFKFRGGFLDRAECFHYQYGMMSNNRPPALANDGWMRHAL